MLGRQCDDFIDVDVSLRAVQYWLFIQVIFLDIIHMYEYIVIIHIRLYNIIIVYFKYIFNFASIISIIFKVKFYNAV